MHANTHTHVHAHAHARTHTRTCTRTHTHTHIYMHTYIHTRTRTLTRTNAHAHAHAHAQTHTHTHTPTHTHTRIHLYAHTLISVVFFFVYYRRRGKCAHTHPHALLLHSFACAPILAVQPFTPARHVKNWNRCTRCILGNDQIHNFDQGRHVDCRERQKPQGKRYRGDSEKIRLTTYILRDRLWRCVRLATRQTPTFARPTSAPGRGAPRKSFPGRRWNLGGVKV